DCDLLQDTGRQKVGREKPRAAGQMHAAGYQPRRETRGRVETNDRGRGKKAEGQAIIPSCQGENKKAGTPKSAGPFSCWLFDRVQQFEFHSIRGASQSPSLQLPEGCLVDAREAHTIAGAQRKVAVGDVNQLQGRAANEVPAARSRF